LDLYVLFINLEYSLSVPRLANNYKGPNLSGAEFNPGPGKRYGYDYIYPTTKEIDYYASKGFGIIRMPFDMTRVYPEPYSPLNTTEIIYMRLTVDHCLSKGIRVILDPHNYGFIYDSRTEVQREIGVDVEGTNLFKDFWSKMGLMYKNYPNVIFGLMNEPNKQTAIQWYTGAIPAIKAIRDAGATQMILIPGTGWTGAHSWISSGNAQVWTGFKDDPLNNFAFEMHQYLDADSSGTHNTCIANSTSSLESATNWLSTNKFKGFLGEFGWSTDSSCTNEGPSFLDYISSNSDVWMGWTWWCGGPWYPSNYIFMLDPISYNPPIVDRPQMSVLLKHL
jgi:endoglucanase